MKLSPFYIITLAILLVYPSFFALLIESRGLIGVDYGLSKNLLSPSQAVALLHAKSITRVRRYEAIPTVTQAFADAGIDLILGVPNKYIPKLASSSEEAAKWVLKNVVPFPTANISAIIVGNEWFYSPSNDPSFLLPAMQNIYKALNRYTVTSSFLGDIKVSTSHAFNVISSYFPPSTAKFTYSIAPVMAPVLSFLSTTESFFMVDIFPYLLAAENPQDKSLLQFALFNSTQVVQDPYTHLDYTNLFDVQLDAVYAAIESLISSTRPSPSPSSPPCSGCNPNQTSVDKDIYYTAAHATHRHIPTYTNSGMRSGPGGSRSSPSMAGLASIADNVQDMPNLHKLAYNMDEKQSPLPYGPQDKAQVLLHEQLTYSEMSLTSDNKEIKALQHELKPSVINSSVLPEQGGLSSAPKSSSLSDLRLSLSIAKVEPSSLQSAHKLAADYYSSATSYWDVCSSKGLSQVATIHNAQTYNQNLIHHVLEASSTPANPSTPINAYIFELFDEGQQYGLFYPDGTPVYPISFVESS